MPHLLVAPRNGLAYADSVKGRPMFREACVRDDGSREVSMNFRVDGLEQPCHRMANAPPPENPSPRRSY
jgi:hypothetical protein